MGELQRIVVLCIVITALVAGAFFAGKWHQEGRELIDMDTAEKQIDPPALDIDTAPPDMEVDEVPTSSSEIEEPNPSNDDPVACTLEAKICPDGTAVGRVGPNCEFAACPVSDTRPEPLEIMCTEEQKQAEACTMQYEPVCGLVEVQCVTTPCDPVPETFGNACSACAQGNVISYTKGECREE